MRLTGLLLFSAGCVAVSCTPRRYEPVRFAADAAVVLSLRAPRAQIVGVAGNFNAWKPERDKMRMSADSDWSVALRLEPGIYRYQFVVDGKWVTPPFVRTEPDGFGGNNGVLVVPHQAPICGGA